MYRNSMRVLLLLLVMHACCISSIAQAQHVTLPVTFEPERVERLEMESKTQVMAWATHDLGDVVVATHHPSLVSFSNEPISFTVYNTTHYVASFNLTGVFLGYATVFLQNNDSVSPNLPVSVIRVPGVLDKIFGLSVAILVSLIYINFGCALDWTVVKATIRRPIGPVIGFVSQFGFMPVISFLLGRLLFPNDIAMQLGLFFTGCAPGGGASNIWTVALGGNLHLSITMTAISTFSSFAMIPFWVFTLGRVIFETGNFVVPYGNILRVAAGLLIPLIIGTLIQFHLPKLSNFLVRVMKPFAVFLIIFIVVFATVANLYIFSLFNWQVVVGGMCIPWLGYLFGTALARGLRQNWGDTIAIAVETGVQNSGIAIFMLRFSLEQPAADLAQVCPVAVSLMTPIPLALLSFALRYWRSRNQSNMERLPSTELTTPTGEQILGTKNGTPNTYTYNATAG